MKSTLCAVIVAGAVFGCGLTESSKAAGLDELPADVQQRLYAKETLDPQQPVGPSAYRDWKPKNGPPWTIGYASSYAGNTWRVMAMERLQNVLLPKWKKLGLIKNVIITQSDLKDSAQIQQIRQLVDQNVDAIILCCSNPTALNRAVTYAFDKGVPVFSFTGYLTSPYAINSSTNYQLGGYLVGKAMAEQLHGQGNVLLVEGIQGTSGSDSQDRGMKDGLADSPGIKIVGEVTGMWTDQIAQTEVRRWLNSHSVHLDGVVAQSADELGVLWAIQQSGRKMMPISFGGETGALCYWRKHPDLINAAYQLWPPGDDIELAWNIMMRTLEGQGPKIQSVLVDPVKFTFDDVKARLAETCDENSNKWENVGVENWGGNAYLDQFFLRPADPEAFKP
jgi:ribose transport system substrate-binding protein